MSIPEIIVCGRDRAAEWLRSERRSELRYIVSIGDPGQPSPDGLMAHPARKLRLRFNDVDQDPHPVTGYVAASRDDVDRLVKFLQRVDGTTLIHCAAGVSRSTAAAFILLCILLGPGREEEALDHLHRLATDRVILPNRRLVWFADDLLGRKGAMRSAHRARFRRWFTDELLL